ncbi:MAG: carbohydrate binding domain-containing protein [Candidatus Zipacnadales bacterium]
MRVSPWNLLVGIAWFLACAEKSCPQGDAVTLPQGVMAVWDMDKASRETTSTRERICINGLWRWQPAATDAETVPTGNWGYFKVPGSWPGITDYMQKDCQTVFPHQAWESEELRNIKAAWYARRIAIPLAWEGRRITVSAEYVNSYAAVYLDGRHVGDIHFPAGEVELTDVCQPGTQHDLSLLVVAMPLRGVMLSYNDTASAREVQGTVARRGLCGDVFLCSMPSGPRIVGLRTVTALQRGEVTFQTAITDLVANEQYALHVQVVDKGQVVHEFTTPLFSPTELANGWCSFTQQWRPEKLWDVHTPENQYDIVISLLDATGKVLDTNYPQRTGFREFRIEGRDFYLNGSRIFLSAVPLDNAQVGAAWASYEGARKSLLRLKSFGINFVYTHNYGCEPGSHLSFTEVLRAADDVGMLVALSQPHFGHYEWKAEDADINNGYARHAKFYTQVAALHPSVVAYSMSHNATGYSEDMNPDLIDGVRDPRDEWSLNNVKLALRAEAIVHHLDPTRIVYHHSSGNLSSMHTVNFYPNFVPIQELSDWFEHWATEGQKPVFLCEYGAPFSWDWTMYRGWYKGTRSFGSAVVPWEFCLAEWNAQFLGDPAFRITDMEKENLRWEAAQFRAGNLWHRWDYPYEVGSREFADRHEVMGRYITDNWRAHRTWGLSANSPWEHGHFWKLREGVDKKRQELPVDWEALQRPGFSPDYIEDRYERMDLAFEYEDWIPTAPAQALLRNNRPLLAYIGGGPKRFTNKDHNFIPGETVAKQLIVINNSRVTVDADCEWRFALSHPLDGRKSLTIPTGEQARIPLQFSLPPGLSPGAYKLTASVTFSTGETQTDTFVVDVLPSTPPVGPLGKVALFDPQGDTGRLLNRLGVTYEKIEADTDLSPYEILVIGKGALSVSGAAPKLIGVQDGLRVIVFEQTSEVLEKRLGFRVVEYGLRQVFPRVPDHPVLAGLNEAHLHDWRGEATLLPPRLKYEPSARFNGAPSVRWCGIEVTRLWRCGCQGNVASVLIEKPARGDFLPIVDGGYSLQYSPLIECHEGQGLILFCQLDVSGRTEPDPAADHIARNLLSYAAAWKPSPRRTALYVGEPVGRHHLEFAGIPVDDYEGGPLTTDHVLIVGPGSSEKLITSKSMVTNFLREGGNLLALGLDASQANTFLPFQVVMTQAEHIACFFEPPALGSLLEGIGPADVHNRIPCELPLVSGGAEVIGDGVLAKAKRANVVFYQLPPYTLTSSQGAAPSFVVDEVDAVEGTRSALITMGATTQRGAQFGQKVEVVPEVGQTYTFAVFVKGVGGPVTVHLEVERAGKPWDRAVKGPDVTVTEDEWTDVHVTFRTATSFAEGWQAYIGCSQDGGRFRADLFRLYEGEYVPKQTATTMTNLIQNPGFEAGAKPWFFMFSEQQNLRRTYRRASYLLTRLLANMGVRGDTPLLSRFCTPLDEAAGASVLRNGGLSLDANEDGVADEWSVSGTGITEHSREQVEGIWVQRLATLTPNEKGEASVMFAQYDVPVREGQWYQISFRARAEGLGNTQVTMTLTNTETWRSFFEYQRFAPRHEWKDFAFKVQSTGTAEARTRFQIWYNGLGTLWLSDLRMVPIDPPTEGRWLSGFYLDEPEEWDDPYRFFRW